MRDEGRGMGCRIGPFQKKKNVRQLNACTFFLRYHPSFLIPHPSFLLMQFKSSNATFKRLTKVSSPLRSQTLGS